MKYFPYIFIIHIFFIIMQMEHFKPTELKDEWKTAALFIVWRWQYKKTGNKISRIIIRNGFFK